MIKHGEHRSEREEEGLARERISHKKREGALAKHM